MVPRVSPVRASLPIAWTEYDDWPRGKIIYEKPTQHFVQSFFFSAWSRGRR